MPAENPPASVRGKAAGERVEFERFRVFERDDRGGLPLPTCSGPRVEVRRVDHPGDERDRFLGIPSPESPPRLVRPDAAEQAEVATLDVPPVGPAEGAKEYLDQGQEQQRGYQQGLDQQEGLPFATVSFVGNLKKINAC